ncbi:hypothetical protein ACGFIX_26825 [Nocardia salmonicida]
MNDQQQGLLESARRLYFAGYPPDTPKRSRLHIAGPNGYARGVIQ